LLKAVSIGFGVFASGQSARLLPLYRVGVDAAKNPPAVTEVWDGVGRQKGRPFGRLIDRNSRKRNFPRTLPAAF
jgi:hypothetical protein